MKNAFSATKINDSDEMTAPNHNQQEYQRFLSITSQFLDYVLD